MARSGINYVDVARAAEEIQQESQEPTVDRVRAVLGTGSKSTIAPLLKRWKEQTGNTQIIVGIPKDLANAVQSLYEQTQAAAELSFSTRSQELTKKLEGVTSQLNGALRKTALLKEENRVLGTDVSKLKTDLSESQEEKIQLQTELAKTKAESNQRQALLSEHKETIREIKSENKDIREHFEHYQHHTAEERQCEREQFANSLQTERDRSCDINNNLEFARKELSEALALANGLNILKSEQQSQIESMETELTTIKSRFFRLTEEHDSNTQEFAVMTKLLNESKEESRELNSKLILANRESKMLHSRIAELSQQLEMAISKQEKINDRLHLVSQEKSVIQGQFIQLQNSL